MPGVQSMVRVPLQQCLSSEATIAALLSEACILLNAAALIICTQALDRLGQLEREMLV